MGVESPRIERLEAADLMLAWPEAKGWPQDIGALAILDGQRLLDADGRILIEPAREHIRRRLHLVPRFPLVPITANLSIGVGALSYAGQFNMTVVADLQLCPDVEIFVDGVRHALDALQDGISGS